jgi:L-lactate dehydrogenase
MSTAGMNEKAGGATNRHDPAGRLKLLEVKVGIFRQILPEIFKRVPEAVILVVRDLYGLSSPVGSAATRFAC